MVLKKISASALRELKELYKVKWPLHIGTYNLIRNFAERIEKDPKWEEKAEFWSLNGNWRQHGSFVMTFGFLIHFDTLDTAPYRELKQTLMLMDYKKFMMFNEIREDLAPVVHDVIKERKLELHSEHFVRYYFAPKDLFKNVTVPQPEGYTLKPLRQEHAEKINSLWPHRNEFSLEYVEHLIKHNVNTGLFDENDDLVAWTLSYDHGAMGIGQVVESHQRKNLYLHTFTKVATRIAQENDLDIYFWIVKGNKVPEIYMSRANFQVLGEKRLIKVINSKAIALKNHL